MRFLRSEHGQATIDYVALVAVLAVLLALAAGATAAGAPGIANGVLGQFRRALCLVAGEDCPLPERRPCTLASERRARHVSVNLAIIRLDEDTVLLRERLSDGTFRLTVSTRDGAGAEAAIGADGHVSVGGHDLKGEAEARGGAQGVIGHGAVYYARSRREADRLQELIRWSPNSLPPASEVFAEGGARVLGRASASGGVQELSGQIDGMASQMLGLRRDRRSGRDTISLSTGASGSGLVSAAIAGEAGVLDGQAVLGLTLDRDHRPVELVLTATGRVAAGTSLPSGIANALTQLIPNTASAETGGRRWELGARLDLRDPDVARAWQAFRQSPTSRDAIRGLGEALRTHATLDMRSYRLESSTSGAGASAALGLKIGGEFENTTDSAQLLAAVTRPPFGLWEPRLDCLEA